jgi:glycolate oxidase
MDYDFKPLEEILGSRLTADRFECRLYGKDLAPLPKIVNLMFKTTPDAVVSPKTPKEVSEIMKFANKNKIPVTPRASATSALGNVVPTRAGIVMDMSSMDNKIEINKEEKTVTVSSGVVWKKLEKALNQKGLALMTYPSSAPSATVGGWLSSPGYGIGTLKYGRVYEQVLKLELILPDGTVKQCSGDEKNKFLGTEGTTGIITEAELKVRELPESEVCHLLTFDSQEIFCDTLEQLVKLNPFNISYANKKYVDMVENAGGGSGHEYVNPGFNFKFRCLVVFNGSKKSVDESSENLNNIKKSGGVREEPQELAREEWEERFNPMKIKRRGPTLLAGDLLIPLSKLNAVISKVNKININELGIEGTVASKDKIVVMPMYLTDERRFPDFVFALRHLKKMNDIAVSAGGVPYGTGLWNSPYVHKIMNKETFREKNELKKQVDSGNILNPDKYLGAKLTIPSLVFNPMIYGLSMFGAEIASKPLQLMKLIK